MVNVCLNVRLVTMYWRLACIVQLKKGTGDSQDCGKNSGKKKYSQKSVIDQVVMSCERRIYEEQCGFRKDNLPGYKAFNSVRTKKQRGGLSFFCRNDLFFQALEVSSSNTEIIEHVHVTFHSPNKITINIVGIYRASSHGVRRRFPSEVEKITSSFSSRELNVLCGDISIDLLKLDNIGKSYVDMMIN